MSRLKRTLEQLADTLKVILECSRAFCFLSRRKYWMESERRTCPVQEPVPPRTKYLPSSRQYRVQRGFPSPSVLSTVNLGRGMTMSLANPKTWIHGRTPILSDS